VTLAANAAFMPRDDRIRGCILGGAIGDALGAPVEFSSLEEIRRRFGDAGVTGYAETPGRLTDDTQLTLFTALGLAQAHARYSEKGIVSIQMMVDVAYARWLATQGERSQRWPGSPAELFDDMDEADRAALNQRRAPGRTTVSALLGEQMGTVEEPVNSSKGCGGVMRVAPVGLCAVTHPEPFDLGCDLAAITHGHPSGYLAAGALAQLVNGISDGLDLDRALDAVEHTLRRRRRHEEVLGALRAARALAASDTAPGPEAVESLGAGWVAEEALAIGVYCALAARGFPHGVLLAVNHSGDSDSTGSIAGNILGALGGSAALLADWVEELELRGTIERLCATFTDEFFPPGES
jgi:ADP-ribosyl-[dinitrogen reductase] hydrolase